MTGVGKKYLMKVALIFTAMVSGIPWADGKGMFVTISSTEIFR
jgi:hypothetical protein